MGSHKVNNVTDPSAAQDAATKNYVDTSVASFDEKPSVAYASASALPANSYSNGSSGVGATLTGSSNGPLIIDSVTLVIGAVGQRILVAGEAAPANNGWYTLTQIGTVAVSPYILTRATESDTAAEIGPGYLTGVIAPNTLTPGTANNGKVFISVAADPFTVGTTSLTFSQVGGTYSAGTGLSLSGSTFSVDTSVTPQKSDNLSVFGATSSAQLRGVLSDELGTGAAIFDGATPTSGAFVQSVTEAASTPVSDTTDTTTSASTIRWFSFFTLPSTEKFYRISGIEWKNGATATGNISCGVAVVDANPPVGASHQNVAWGGLIAAAGTSTIQRNSTIASGLIAGGTILGAWVQNSSASGVMRTATVSSNNNRKTIASANAAAELFDNTAWVANIVQAYIKVYYVGYK